MLKGAWILPVVMLVALILAAFFPIESFAAERNGIDWAKTPAAPKTEFKDLPGVVSEAERAQKPDYTCTTGIAEVYVGRGRYDTLYGDTMPRRVYHCETESGLTYTGTEMPNTQWVPGLNPHHLPK